MATGSLGNLVVGIGTDTKELVKGLAGAQKNIEGFKNSANKILGLIGFSLTAAAFVDLGKKTIEYGNVLNKFSEQTGMAASEIAKLKYVAEQSDTSLEAVTGTFRFLSRAINEASSGNAEAIQTFQRFHVEFRNANGTMRNYKDVMLDVAERIKNTSNETVILAEGQKLLGRGVQQVLPLFKQGADGIKNLTSKYEEMQKRIGLTDAQINTFAKNSDALGDAWLSLSTAFQFFLIDIMTPLIPKMKEFVDVLTRGDWATVAADLELTAQAIGKIFGFITDSIQLGPAGRLVAALSAGAGTLAGGGSLADAFGAAGGAAGNPQGAAAARYGGLGNPVDLGSITVGGGGAGKGSGQGIQGSGEASLPERLGQKMDELSAKWKDVNKQIADVWGGTLEMISTGFGTSVADMIVDGKDFGDAMKEMWTGIAKMAIAELVKIVVQQMIVFAWQMLTGTVGTGNLAPGMDGSGGGRKKLFGIFGSGGYIPQAREGLFAANGLAVTPPHGEGGMPAIVHPGEIISPIDKLFDFMKSMSQGGVTVYATGRVADDPHGLAEAIALENDRRRRRPSL